MVIQTESDERHVRLEPRISLNSLAKYIDTPSATKRRSILHGHKYPGEIPPRYYNDAFDPIVAFLTDPEHSEHHIEEAIEELHGTPDRSPSYATRKAANIAALESVLEAVGNFPMGEYTIRKNSEQSPHLLIGGVSISVRPEFELVYKPGLRGEKVGALKLFLGKSDPLSSESGAMVATTVHQHAETFASADVVIDHRHCYVLDVFQKAVHAAPRNFQRRRHGLEFACQEIAAIWPQV